MASGVLWMLFQPFLFGLIGAAVKSEQIHDVRSLGKYEYIKSINLYSYITVYSNISFYSVYL